MNSSHHRDPLPFWFLLKTTLWCLLPRPRHRSLNRTPFLLHCWGGQDFQYWFWPSMGFTVFLHGFTKDRGWKGARRKREKEGKKKREKERENKRIYEPQVSWQVNRWVDEILHIYQERILALKFLFQILHTVCKSVYQKVASELIVTSSLPPSSSL